MDRDSCLQTRSTVLFRPIDILESVFIAPHMASTPDKEKIEAKVSKSTLEALHALQGDKQQSLGEVIDYLVGRSKHLLPIRPDHRESKVRESPVTCPA